ncbi:hypothetical protein GGF42_009474, partial [Coemansia sp. RSA 2424]
HCTDEESDEPDDLGLNMDADPDADGSDADGREDAGTDGSADDRDSGSHQPKARQTARRGRGRVSRGGSRGGEPDRPPPGPRTLIKQKERVRNQRMLAQRVERAQGQARPGDRQHED